MTCYNRVEKTLSCLNHFYNAAVPENIVFDIYLVDDNSPDQTGKIVKDKYPNINVTFGTGSLYWNRGMRLAWKKARQQRDYDFYLWLNDDTYIKPNAIEAIFYDYFFLVNNKIHAVVSGVCQDLDSDKITYGGLDDKYHLLAPNGSPQSCKYINGNFTLVSKEIFHKLSYLSFKYSHAAGDHDYSLRARKNGFQCYITSSALAVCSRGESNTEQDWHNPNISLRNRIQNLFSIKGGNFVDYTLYSFVNFGLLKTVKIIFWRFRKVLFPFKEK